VEALAERYRQFAVIEARGASPLCEELAAGVAEDEELLRLLTGLPEDKQQPNLLLAATRYVAGLAGDYRAFRRLVLAHQAEVLETMRTRRTQTNEPARCAGVYPLLATLAQPLALLEVGASAGLCLFPDRYRYEYDGRPAGDPGSPVLLRSDTGGTLPEPGPISVAWRAGIDLNPLDVTDPDAVRWLETLVWPGEDGRLERLHAAIGVARRDPPRVVRGDLNDRLAAVAAQAPREATLVVFHTAVLWYLDDAGRRRFAGQVRGLDAHWIAQERPGLIPDQPVPEQPPDGPSAAYLLTLDGRPFGFSAPHGGWLHWSG
jgi:hypothetical protein